MLALNSIIFVSQFSPHLLSISPDVHEGSFIVFMASAILFMLLTCILFRLTATQPMTDEVHSYILSNNKLLFTMMQWLPFHFIF